MKNVISDCSMMIMLIAAFIILIFALTMPVHAMGVSDNEVVEDSPNDTPDDTPYLEDDKQQSDLSNNQGGVDNESDSSNSETISEDAGNSGQSLYMDDEYRQCLLNKLDFISTLLVALFAFVTALIGIVFAGNCVRWFCK